jgi:predicted DNA-binding protein (MmcQ/YjbR family)
VVGNKVFFCELVQMRVQETIRELAEYASTLKGAEVDWETAYGDDVLIFEGQLPGISWGSFVKIQLEDNESSESFEQFALLPVLAERLAEYQGKYPAIRDADWVERDGHVYMTAPLDGKLSLAFLKSLVDEAYALVWNKLRDDNKFLIEKSAR